ncbi:MAG: hypothetical protein L3J07_00890 [Candidatus Magasanikbacteria bacterium]|nr:hypothetical protein [Candidatus Magasanikbacteria bacterium]
MKKSKDMDVSGQEKGVKWICRCTVLCLVALLVYKIIIGDTNDIHFFWEKKNMLEVFANHIKNLH